MLVGVVVFVVVVNVDFVVDDDVSGVDLLRCLFLLLFSSLLTVLRLLLFSLLLVWLMVLLFLDVMVVTVVLFFLACV